MGALISYETQQVENNKSSDSVLQCEDSHLVNCCIYCSGESQYCTQRNNHYCDKCNIVFKFPSIVSTNSNKIIVENNANNDLDVYNAMLLAATP